MAGSSERHTSSSLLDRACLACPGNRVLRAVAASAVFDSAYAILFGPDLVALTNLTVQQQSRSEEPI